MAYRLYMELLKRYAFSLLSLINGPNYQKYDVIAFAVCQCFQFLKCFCFTIKITDDNIELLEFLMLCARRRA